MLYTLFKNIIMKNVFYFLIILLTITSCKKKCEEPIKEKPTFECSEIPPYDKVGFGYEYLVDNNSQIKPYFNPNNGNEFIYEIHNYNQDIATIYKYNILTKTKTLIYTTKSIYHIQWSLDDWIIFNNGNLQKIKSDGTELTFITQLHSKFTLKNGGNNILYIKKDAIVSDYEYYFTDIKNNIYDSLTITQGHISFEWGTNNKIIFSETEAKHVYNLTNNTLTTYCENFTETLASNSKWINNTEFVWADLSNIYKTNINTTFTDTILSFCNSFKYQSFDYSPLTNKLICHRLTKKLLENDVIKVNNYIVIMNTDGTEKEIIDLDRVCE